MSRTAQTSERLVRTAFWTFFVLTVGFTTYGFLVEEFGLGLFLRNDLGPKLHMRGEAHLAGALSAVTAPALLIASFIVCRWSRILLGMGLTGCALWFVYYALPRY